MCRARSEGGQRCVGHARDTLGKAVERRATAFEFAESQPKLKDGRVNTQVVRRLLAAECALADAMAQYASTPEGEQALSQRLDDTRHLIEGEFDPTFNHPVMLQVALTQGRALRKRADWVRAEVRAGTMTKETATTVSRFPSEPMAAFAKSELWVTGRETGFEPLVDPVPSPGHTFEERVARGTWPHLPRDQRGYPWRGTTLQQVGAAEQALAWRRAEVDLGRGSRAAVAVAENDLFDARANLAIGYGDYGVDLLNAQHDAIPPHGTENRRDREAIRAALDAGVRHRRFAEEAHEQVEARRISYEEFVQRAYYPPFEVYRDRLIAITDRFGEVPPRVNFNWR